MKLKNMLIALFMVIGTSLMAQEKYEQATVTLYLGGYLEISVEGKEHESKKLKPQVQIYDNTPLLKEIASMRDEGWEVWNVQQMTPPHMTTYFLRRKLK